MCPAARPEARERRGYRDCAPTLVILAAGRSTRFGRLKQLTPVGPSGEALLDYAMYDAVQAGFARVVLVIQKDLRGAFEEHFGHGTRFKGGERFYAFQPLAHPTLAPRPPTGRTRPWGTGFAVVAAGLASTGQPIETPFAVCNADDFYGRAAFATLAAALRQWARAPRSPTQACTVGYPVGTTLSHAGGVARGICTVDPSGNLLELTEGLNLRKEGDLAIGHDPDGRAVAVDLKSPVCTNLWGFQPDVIRLLRGRFAAFLAAGPGRDREFHLSGAVNDLVARGELRCSILATRERWLGVTFPEDHAGVAAALRDMVDSGVYPERLWDAPQAGKAPAHGVHRQANATAPDRRAIRQTGERT